MSAQSLFISRRERPRVNEPFSTKQTEVYGTFSGKEGGSDGKEGGSDGKEGGDMAICALGQQSISSSFPEILKTAA